MHMRDLQRPVYAILGLLLGTTPVLAASLTVTNPGFEDDVLTPQNVTSNTISGWLLYDPDDGVTEGYQYGAFNPTGAGGSTFGVNTGYVSNGAAQGNNVAYLYCCRSAPADPFEPNAAFAIEQTLSATLTANTQYNLSVQVGNGAHYTDYEALFSGTPDNLNGFPGYKVELLAGDTVIGVDNDSVSIADGQYGTSNVTVTFAAGNAALTPLIGQDLTIRLWNLGADPTNDPFDGEADGFQVDFDNVTLTTLSGPSADANGPYTYSAANLSVTLDGSGSSDPDGDISGYSWKVGGTEKATGVNPALALINSGLTSTTDTGTVELTVTDAVGFVSTDTATLLYQNADPEVIDATGTEQGDLSMEFDATFDDDDLIANGIVAGFETLSIEISLSAIFGSGFLSDIGTSLMDTLDRLSLEGILGGGAGTYTLYANVQDKAGATASLPFEIMLSELPAPGSVPAPAPAAMLLLGLAGLAVSRRRRIRFP